MKNTITSVETAVATVPLARPFRGGRWLFPAVSNALVRVGLADSTTGWGYAFAFSEARARVLEQGLRSMAGLLLGGDALARADLSAHLETSAHAVELGTLIHPLIGAIDMALWDIAGKTAGLPLYRLLGGGRNRVPAYGSGGSLDLTVRELEAEVADFATRGFGAVKMKLRGDASDIERVRAVRRTLGDSVEILVDANQQLDPKRARRLAQTNTH